MLHIFCIDEEDSLFRDMVLKWYYDQKIISCFTSDF